MTGHGNVVISPNEATNLRNYLLSGGFLHIDDNYGMDEFIRVELKKLFPEVQNLAPIALQWILSFPEVSCIIPGASTESHVLSNLSTLELPALTPEKIAA